MHTLGQLTIEVYIEVTFPFLQDGRTALLIAARNGKGEIVKVLVDVGASLEAKQMVSTNNLILPLQ